MKQHLVNASYGVLDYAAYPVGMLIVAPIVLHRLGAAEYGIWTIATAVISVGGVIASGFCDANIQRVAKLRTTGHTSGIEQTVRSILGINLLLGSLLAIAAFAAAPLAAQHIARGSLEQVHECTIALRIAAGLILLRAVDAVSVSTQRAFLQFGGTTRISTAVRLLTLGGAALLALNSHRAVSMLALTGCIMAVGVVLQFRQLRKLVIGASLRPSFQPQETKTLLRLGIFTWLQAFGSVIFGQFDRVILGLAMGAAAVAPYSLCVQFAHPIFGLTASALSFLFPHLSGRASTASSNDFKRSLKKAFACNCILVACGAAIVLSVGPRILQTWAEPAVAHIAVGILPAIVLGSSLMGLSVTATYALLALGIFRTVAVINLSARALTLLAMTYVIHRAGIHGLAMTRVAYGVVALLLYVPMLRALRTHKGPEEQVTPHYGAVNPTSAFAEGMAKRLHT